MELQRPSRDWSDELLVEHLRLLLTEDDGFDCILDFIYQLDDIKSWRKVFALICTLLGGIVLIEAVSVMGHVESELTLSGFVLVAGCLYYLAKNLYSIHQINNFQLRLLGTLFVAFSDQLES